jgi:hypothetical protein
LAERLAQKYKHITATRSTPVEQRDKTYKIVSAAIPTTTNSIGVDQDGTDFSYFAQVRIGSNGTPMNMLLDTGAGTSWVMGHDCTSEPCKNHNNFGAQDSTTYKETGVDFELHYGSGNVTGHMATDTFTLAGLTVKPTFGVALVASDDFNNFPIDGILGLAQSKGPHDTFIETLVASKILKANMFGVSISRSADGPNTGVLNFGFPDTTRFVGDLAYTSVHAEKKEQGDWAIPMDDISFDGKKAGIQFKVAYIDTGTSYIFTRKEEVKKLHDLIPGATSEDGITWRVPCTTITDLRLTFGTNSYAISSKDWVGPVKDGKCTSNIYGHDVVGDAWLLGDTFLKNVYAVFDVDQHRIGKDSSHNVFFHKLNNTGLAARPPPPVMPTSTSSGGLNPSPSSTVPPSTTSSVAPGSPGSVTSSNALPVGATASPVDTKNPPGAGTTSPPGMGGHQTSPGTSVAEAIQSSAKPSISSLSAATRVDSRFTGVAITLLGVYSFFS